jgi:hypothetical protein
MTGLNRGRYTITIDGPWRLYTDKLLGWTMTGTIQRGLEIGALALSPVGIYAQINAGAVRELDQRKVSAALGIKQISFGRPAEMQGGKKVNTYLDAKSIELATRLGNGNVSYGIRKALKLAAINTAE